MEQSDRIMRRNRKLALALAAACVLAVLGSLAADRFPLNRAFLQSHLDGNQKDGTNFGTLAATNFAGNGAGLTNVPLSALAQSGADTNQVPKWNGVAWAPGTVSGGFDWTNVWQYGSANLTNWSALGTNAFEWRYQAGDGDLTNWAQLATNAFEWRYQRGDATLTNLAGLDSASDGQVIKWTSGAWAVGNDDTGSGGGGEYYGPFTNLTVFDQICVTNILGTSYGGCGIRLDGTNRVVTIGTGNGYNADGTTDALIVGEAAGVTNSSSVIVSGDGAKVTDNDSGAAIGLGARATNNHAIAIGTGAVAGGRDSVAIGKWAYATGIQSIMINADNSLVEQPHNYSVGIKGENVDIVANDMDLVGNSVINISSPQIRLNGAVYHGNTLKWLVSFPVAADQNILVLSNETTASDVFTVSTNGLVAAQSLAVGATGTNVISDAGTWLNGVGITNGVVYGRCWTNVVLDCASAVQEFTLTERMPTTILKSNATYNALIYANGATNTIVGSLVWVDCQPIGTTNWILKW